MNKEIEELLNELKEYASGGMSGLYPSEDTVKKFVSYIEQLQTTANNCKQLENNRDKALKIIDSYDLGKYDYSIPPGGIIELRETLKGDSDEQNN